MLYYNIIIDVLTMSTVMTIPEYFELKSERLTSLTVKYGELQTEVHYDYRPWNSLLLLL